MVVNSHIVNHKIENDAFSGDRYCNEVIIPDHVKCIGQNAFKECKNLRKLVLSSNLEKIENAAFAHCNSLSGVLILPNNLSFIDANAFNCCESLNGVIFGNELRCIDTNAFYYCKNLKGRLVIPDKVDTIGVRAFDNCDGITSVKIGKSLTSISSNTFANCRNLSGTLVIPDNITFIGNYAFSNCNLSVIEIGDGLKTIGKDAFQLNDNLKYIQWNNHKYPQLTDFLNAFGKYHHIL
jgi:hypothetical protein